MQCTKKIANFCENPKKYINAHRKKNIDFFLIVRIYGAKSYGVAISIIPLCSKYKYTLHSLYLIYF